MSHEQRCRTQQAIADQIRRACELVDAATVASLVEGTVELSAIGMMPPWLWVIAVFMKDPTLNDALRTVLAGQPFANELAPPCGAEEN